jgi:zinc/manganese transport system substrate-binding protein
MKKTLFLLWFLAPLFTLAAGKIKIVSSLTDHASIASFIGGDRVEVFSIGSAKNNPHQVELFPSYMVKVMKASIYLKNGLGLDQWADEIIRGSRNGGLMIVDCSEGIEVLEKPSGKADASKGDVHPYGNPHYWLDPRNGIIIAGHILGALVKTDPENRSAYEARCKTFDGRCDSIYAAMRREIGSEPSTAIFTYHSSWAYFASAFDLEIAEQIEPFPGIPPSGNHLARLVDITRHRRIGFMIIEPYFSDDAARFLNRETGVPYMQMSPSCDNAGPDSYIDHFRTLIHAIAEVKKGRVK